MLLVPFSSLSAMMKLLGKSRLPEKSITLNDTELFGGWGDIEEFIVSLT